jgi:predicted RNase H-like HicB family nuclease
LSYAKDCRNTYGENDKASRKNIPLRKAKVNRAYRKKVNQVLQKVSGDVDLEKADLLESEARSIKRDNWKKSSDMPLGEFVENQLERRESHAGNGKTARKIVRESVANLKIETEQETDGRWIAEATELNGVMVYGETSEKAIKRCKRLASYVFLEELGAGKILEINDNYISVETY